MAKLSVHAVVARRRLAREALRLAIEKLDETIKSGIANTSSWGAHEALDHVRAADKLLSTSNKGRT